MRSRDKTTGLSPEKKSRVVPCPHLLYLTYINIFYQYEQLNMLINIMMYMCIFFFCLLIMNFTMKMIDEMIILK